MRTVWKTVLQLTDEQTVEMPTDSVILLAMEQHEQACVWYLCDPQAMKVKRTFYMVGTGHPAPADCYYVGTAKLRSGNLMLHIFTDLIR